jgi:tetratricopeptide (TPR) repeat protein
MDAHVLAEALPFTGPAGQVHLISALRGQDRTRLLREYVELGRSEGVKGCLLSCDFAQGGPWAGVTELFGDLVTTLESKAPDLLIRHDYELVSVLPSLRARLNPRNPTLTDVAGPAEQVRLYPADRAFRILHGLIDLIAEWKDSGDGRPWLVVCDAFDSAGFLVRHFFSELMRRRGRSHQLILVIAGEPVDGPTPLEGFVPEVRGKVLSLPCEPDRALAASAGEMARQAQELEDQVGTDPLLYEAALPRLIRLWSLSGTPAKAAPWQYEAFSIYTSRGFYMDSIVYGEGALEHLEREFPGDEAKRWRIINKLFASYCVIGNPQRALEIVEGTLSRLESPKFRALAHYVMAMMYARYLPDKDFPKAETHLETGLADLHKANLSTDELHFQVAFNRNGLAFVRYRQGSFADAIQLCQEGFERLRDGLKQDRHRLHRSVLLYNIAQVYSSLREHDKAIEYYTAAMEMDPHYSEYYNERGNLWLKQGYLENALKDYLSAIEMSPPFPEVWVNLGQCRCRMNQIGDALEAYSTSLDLDPLQPEVHVMRAQCFESIGDLDSALSAYESSLALKPDQPLVLANRACLKYQLGQITAALRDLNHAVELDPSHPDLYQNRAVALADLGRSEEAVHDLETYLRLRPDAEDLDETFQRICTLRAQSQPFLGERSDGGAPGTL